MNNMLSILAGVDGDIMLPVQASTIAPDIDWLMWFIVWVSIIFGAMIFIGTIYIGWRYRHRPGINDKGKGASHSTLLEITWSVLPGILLALMAIWGFEGYMHMSEQPTGEVLEIQVEGRKWAWTFTYPNGYTDNELHVPKGQKVRLVLTSTDVIHSLYLPQFRNKKDCVPGRYNKMWVEATLVSPMGKDLSKNPDPLTAPSLDPVDPTSYTVVPNDKNDPQIALQNEQKKKNGFDIYCAEYCGQQHSRMLTKVHVHEDYASWRAWLLKASDIYGHGPDGKPLKTATEIGFALANKNGCFGCHSVNGTRGTGPSWQNIFGRVGKFTDGTSYTADENYIKESILYPQKHIVETYSGAMPVFRLSDRDITSIIRYMKSISDGYKDKLDELNQEVPKEIKIGTGAPTALAR